MPAAPAHAAQVAPAQTPPPAGAYAAPPAAVSPGDDEPINSIAGVPRRKGARMAFIAAITAVAFVVFGVIAWGAISLVTSLLRPGATPAASVVAAPASASAQRAPVASAPAPVVPPAEPAAAAPAETPPPAAPPAPKKSQSVAPRAPAPAPKPAAKPAPAKPAKKCGTFLKKC
jgi:hypothetical protein